MFLAPRSRFPIAETVNLLVWAFSSNFLHDFTLFVIYMHQNMPISLFKTLFDHFHFHSPAAIIWRVILKLRRKAFDLAKFSLIFSRALDSGLPAVVVRVLLHSYKEQEAWVRWGRRCNSETFGFSNSTRQGSCASPALWSIYLDPLFARLREKGVGCHLAGLFVGVVGYCDDLLLLAPNREAAQIMLKICEEFAEESNIKFSTDTDPTPVSYTHLTLPTTPYV